MADRQGGETERFRDALTARAGSGARTAELARRASAMDGASYRIASEVERPEQVERNALATCLEWHVARFVRRRQDADWKAHQGWFLRALLRPGCLVRL